MNSSNGCTITLCVSESMKTPWARIEASILVVDDWFLLSPALASWRSMFTKLQPRPSASHVYFSPVLFPPSGLSPPDTGAMSYSMLVKINWFWKKFFFLIMWLVSGFRMGLFMELWFDLPSSSGKEEIVKFVEPFEINLLVIVSIDRESDYPQ